MMDIVLPRDVVYELAAKNPQERQVLEECLRDVSWRVAHYGSRMTKLSDLLIGD